MTSLLNRARDPVIATSEPWADDPFGRQQDGDVLCRLVASSIDDPLVISLQSPWGSGKTVFLRRVSAHLKAEYGIPAIRIDAWKSDDFEDPLSTIVSELTIALDSMPKRTRTVTERVDSAISGLASYGSKVGLPAASLLADSFAPGSGMVARAAGAFGRELLESQKKKREAEVTFRKKLEESRDLLTGRARNRPMKPMVLIIDELDRCRPDYAIRMLERIKHYFDIPGITFIVATDHGNLPSAVKTVYGRHVDGELYLRKFFDYEFHLTPPSKEAFAEILVYAQLFPGVQKTDYRSRYEGIYYPQFITEGAEVTAELSAFEYAAYFSFYSTTLELSLRDQLQAMTILTAFLRTRNESDTTLPLVDCLIACLRFSSPSRFRQYLNSGRLILPIINNTDSDSVVINRLIHSKFKDTIQEYLKLKYDGSGSDDGVLRNIENIARSKPLNQIDALSAALLSIRLRNLGSQGKDYMRRVLRLADVLAEE